LPEKVCAGLRGVITVQAEMLTFGTLLPERRCVARRPGLSGLLLGIFLLAALSSLAQTSTNSSPPLTDLRLSDYLQTVFRRNEALQAQMLDAEAARRKHQAERGIFEPMLTSSVTRESTERTNNTEQIVNSGNSTFFSERNTIVDGGLQSLLPSGAKVRLGATVSDLVNNVNPNFNPFGSNPQTNIQQYQTFVGASITQPLLKNGGYAITMASIRLAALDSDIAFQDYRRQLMLTLSQAEAAYWNLYYAQEQLHFFDESVGVTESILSDTQERVKAGQASELEELEAQSGLSVRRTKRNEALQSYYDAMSQARSLSGASPTAGGHKFRAVDVPEATNILASYSETYQAAFELNPDYLVQQKKVAQEKLRYFAAWNQLLPELNLKASYGLNGLGRTASESWELARDGATPAWSIMAELNIPILGNIKGRNQYAAARLTYQESMANLENVQTQIANALDAAIQKARSWQDSIGSYETVVRFNENLLKTQRERLNVGKIEPRKVLEVEADLLDARQSLAQALVQFQRANIQYRMVGGTLLRERGMDITRDELKQKTRAMLDEKKFPENVRAPKLPMQPDAVAN